jgi:4-hydroxy-2-oxoheptanedioate aldolase
MAAENKLKAMLERGQRPTLVTVTTGNPFVAHTLAQLGADGVWIDLESGPAGTERMFELVVAVGHENCPIVRVPSMDGGLVEKAVVHVGVHGVICPMVDTPEQAAELVEHCAEGTMLRARSTAPASAGRAECVAIAQIETVSGFENVEAICATPGLFALMPGPVHLSLSFGGPGEMDLTSEVALGRLRHIVEVAHAHGVYVALPTRTREQFEAVFDLGTDFDVLVHDIDWMSAGCRAAIAMAKEVAAERAGVASV